MIGTGSVGLAGIAIPRERVSDDRRQRARIAGRQAGRLAQGPTGGGCRLGVRHLDEDGQGDVGDDSEAKLAKRRAMRLWAMMQCCEPPAPRGPMLLTEGDLRARASSALPGC